MQDVLQSVKHQALSTSTFTGTIFSKQGGTQPFHMDVRFRGVSVLADDICVYTNSAQKTGVNISTYRVMSSVSHEQQREKKGSMSGRLLHWSNSPDGLLSIAFQYDTGPVQPMPEPIDTGILLVPRPIWPMSNPFSHTPFEHRPLFQLGEGEHNVHLLPGGEKRGT